MCHNRGNIGDRIVRHVRSISTSIEVATHAKEFVHIARCLALANGRRHEAVKYAASPIAERILRAGVTSVRKTAVPAGSTTSPGYGEELSAFQVRAASFIAKIKPRSCFETMFDSFVQLPPHTRAIAVSLGETAFIDPNFGTPGEGQPVPISKMEVSDTLLRERRSLVIEVQSKELLEMAPTAANDLFEKRLIDQTALVTDASFLGSVITTTDVAANSATGNFAADLRTALKAMSIGATSKVFAVCPPEVVVEASFARDSGGALFPNVKYFGGDASGIQIIPSDSLKDSDTVVVIDASQCVAAQGTLAFDSSEEGALQLSDDPTAPAQLVPLWQNNLSALRMRRLDWAFELLDASAAALITNATA
jgi:hypothetical protein